MTKMDPEIGCIFEGMPPPPSEIPDPVQFIRDMRNSFAMPVKPHPAVREFKSSYVARDRAALSIHIWAPSNIDKALPLFVWYHGGGGCVGSPDMNPEFCRDLVIAQKCVIVAPQYRLAPEHKYPIGLEDSWDALKHIALSASQYGADTSAGFVVGGESAGATTAALLTLQARDEKLSPPVSGLFLSAGSYLDPKNIPEQYQKYYRSRMDPACVNAPMLGKGMKTAFDVCLQPDYSSPQYRASIWPSGHHDHPPTYFQTCGLDINRDDNFIYRDILQSNGIETKLDAYPGCPHCFWFLFADSMPGQQWKKDSINGLQWLFTK